MFSTEPWIETQARCLEAALEDAASPEPNTFANAAVAGERLRRMLGAAEEQHAAEEELLQRYDRWLAETSAEMPSGLMSLVEEYLAQIERYAAVPGPDRNPEEGRDLLEALDDLLCIAGAAARRGALSAAELDRVAEACSRRAAAVAPRLHDLWQEAERWIARTAPDPAYPELHSWWEALAVLSAERLLLEAVVARRASIRLANRDAIDAFVNAPPPRPARARATREPISLPIWLALPCAASGTFWFEPREVRVGRTRIRFAPIPRLGRAGRRGVVIQVSFPRPRRDRTVEARVGKQVVPLKPQDGTGHRVFVAEVELGALAGAVFELLDGDKLVWSSDEKRTPKRPRRPASGRRARSK